MPSKRPRAVQPKVAPEVAPSTIGASPLIVTERNGTQHTLTPAVTLDGAMKMAYLSETAEKVQGRLLELLDIDPLAITEDQLTETLGHQQRLAFMNEHMMRALVPDYPQGLYGRCAYDEGQRMVTRAMELAVLNG